MTVSSTINREQYAGDGVTTAFTVHFPFFNDTDVNAIFVDSLGVSTVLALNTDFTVTGGGGAGGSLVASVAPANGGNLTIFRGIPFTQEDDYVEDDPLPADTLEGGFDRAVMRDQQLKDSQDRALTFPVTVAAGVSGELPAPVADALLGFASDGLSIETKTLPAGTAVYSTIANTRAGTAAAEAVTPDGLASFWQQGSNIASATTLVKPADANLGGYHVITGVTTIAALWSGEVAGTTYKLRFSGILQLTNGASLILPRGANITTIVGEVAEFTAEAANVWRCTKWPARWEIADGTAGQVLVSGGAGAKPSYSVGGKLAQEVEFTSTIYQTCSTAIPDDDTIPQSGEGNQVLTGTFTPKSATSTLFIEVDIPVFNSTTDISCAALFKDAGVDAIAAKQFGSNTGTFPKTVTIKHSEVAGSVVARDYKVRVGQAGVGAVYINGNAAARRLGGVERAVMRVREVLA